MAGYVVFRTSNSVHGGLYRCSSCIGFVTPFFYVSQSVYFKVEEVLKGNRCLLWLTFTWAASAMVYEVTDYRSFAFQRCSRVTSPRGKHSQQCFGVSFSTSFVIYSKLPDSKTLLLEHTCAFSPNGIQSKPQSFALHIPLLWLSVSDGFYDCS